jgi:hypothetical protein
MIINILAGETSALTVSTRENVAGYNNNKIVIMMKNINHGWRKINTGFIARNIKPTIAIVSIIKTIFYPTVPSITVIAVDVSKKRN